MKIEIAGVVRGEDALPEMMPQIVEILGNGAAPFAILSASDAEHLQISVDREGNWLLEWTAPGVFREARWPGRDRTDFAKVLVKALGGVDKWSSLGDWADVAAPEEPDPSKRDTVLVLDETIHFDNPVDETLVLVLSKLTSGEHNMAIIKGPYKNFIQVIAGEKPGTLHAFVCDTTGLKPVYREAETAETAVVLALLRAFQQKDSGWCESVPLEWKDSSELPGGGGNRAAGGGCAPLLLVSALGALWVLLHSLDMA